MLRLDWRQARRVMMLITMLARDESSKGGWGIQVLVCEGRHAVYVAQRVAKRAALTTDWKLWRDSDGVVRDLGEAGFVC